MDNKITLKSFWKPPYSLDKMGIVPGGSYNGFICDSKNNLVMDIWYHDIETSKYMVAKLNGEVPLKQLDYQFKYDSDTGRIAIIDLNSINETKIAIVRGWGRLTHLTHNPKKAQDKLGKEIVQILNN